MWVHVHMSEDAPGGQKKALKPLELELQMTVIHRTCAGN